MVCIAVTCNGNGEFWRFETRAAAFLHPLIQYGDPLLLSPRDVVENYNCLDFPVLARRLAIDIGPKLLAEVRSRKPAESYAAREFYAERVFAALVRDAKEPPADLEEIVAMIQRDRKGLNPMARKQSTETHTAETHASTEAVTQAAPAATVAATGEKKAPAPRGPKGTTPESVIRFGKDKEGKSYGPDNNPKKAGSKGHGRFALYEDGMTVAKALEVGIWTADIAWDIERSFIYIEGGVAAAPSAPASEEAPSVTEAVEAAHEASVEETAEQE